MINSFISHLECSKCHTRYSHQQIQTFCPDCKATLLPRYHMEAAKQRVDRDQVSRRKKGMWRWHELLPVLEEENQIFLGEGDTPLLSLPRLQKELGLVNLYVKDESSNPTGSFKDRYQTVTMSAARALALGRAGVITTTGNAGVACAAYAAAAEIPLLIITDPHASPEQRRYWADLLAIRDGASRVI